MFKAGIGGHDAGASGADESKAKSRKA